ncbi:hypothetical protein [Streptomyces silvensis]|uniref:Uncharacterized protein n=1 Tax=Streptomyces silvensis TaxID=1765722 RepID=A0A0W7XBG7_9ACTN|nr:hypothetical protein [Streptomyces silvensis]KUF20284.1 hypothetical protein AT728_31610 [Streptomyces silvensis]
MEHISAAEALTLAAHAAGKQGPGNLLRVVLIVMVVGCVLVAWLLLRGYRQGNERKDAPAGADGSPDGVADRTPSGGSSDSRTPSGGSSDSRES